MRTTSRTVIMPSACWTDAFTGTSAAPSAITNSESRRNIEFDLVLVVCEQRLTAVAIGITMPQRNRPMLVEQIFHLGEYDVYGVLPDLAKEAIPLVSAGRRYHNVA